MPSLVQLEYIVAVADLKHFSKAAEACHISQPTLSQQIRKVEDDLDIVIFDRAKKPIVLTEDGEAILHQARLILREHKRLKELARQKSDEISRVSSRRYSYCCEHSRPALFTAVRSPIPKSHVAD